MLRCIHTLATNRWIANLWWPSLMFAWDIRKTRESTVMKWAFVIFAAFSGLAGSVLGPLACRCKTCRVARRGWLLR